MSWKETLPNDCDVRSVVGFLTVENNAGAKIQCCLCTAYRECNEP